MDKPPGSTTDAARRPGRGVTTPNAPKTPVGGTRVIMLPGLFDDPFLPELGDVYWVRSTILEAQDVRDKRPALVVAVPADLNGRITVVTRTTKLGTPGVPHPADEGLDFVRDGVFARVRSAEARLWTPSNVTRAGSVGPGLLAAVIEEFYL